MYTRITLVDLDSWQRGSQSTISASVVMADAVVTTLAAATSTRSMSDECGGLTEVGGDTHILYVRYMILLQKKPGSREKGGHTGRKMKG